jgi:hypothetical protein
MSSFKIRPRFKHITFGKKEEVEKRLMKGVQKKQKPLFRTTYPDIYTSKYILTNNTFGLLSFT